MVVVEEEEEEEEKRERERETVVGYPREGPRQMRWSAARPNDVLGKKPFGF